MELCPVCKERINLPNQAVLSTHTTLIFVRTVPVPYQMKSEACTAIKDAFARGSEIVQAHVDCCFDLRQPGKVTPVFTIVPKSAA